MIADLEALAPPLIMAAAFLFGLAMFLRRQLGPRSREAEEGDEADDGFPGQASSSLLL